MRFLRNHSLGLLLLYLFVAAIPFWKRHNILTNLSYIDGKFFEYGTIYVYASSLLLVLVFLVWIAQSLIKRQKISLGNKNIFMLILGFLVFSLTSSLFSEFKILSVAGFFCLSQILLLYLLVTNLITSQKKLITLGLVFTASMILQAIIGIAQYFHNGSLGLTLLGETTISTKVLGTAKIIIHGARQVRAYGTFPHPNMLAGFLVLAGIILIVFLFKTKRRLKLLSFLGLLVISLGLFLTFSRVAWLVAAISWVTIWALGLKFERPERKKNLLYLVLAVATAFVILFSFHSALSARITMNDQSDGSVSERTLTYKFAINQFIAHPVFGLGPSTAVPTMQKVQPELTAWQLQPPHNIFIVVLSELGIIGLIFFCLMLFFKLKEFSPRKNILMSYPLFICLFSLLLLSLTDHYLVTTNQGILILGILLGLPNINFTETKSPL